MTPPVHSANGSCQQAPVSDAKLTFATQTLKNILDSARMFLTNVAITISGCKANNKTLLCRKCFCQSSIQ